LAEGGKVGGNFLRGKILKSWGLPPGEVILIHEHGAHALGKVMALNKMLAQAKLELSSFPEMTNGGPTSRS
jgi:hypothetical protein